MHTGAVSRRGSTKVSSISETLTKARASHQAGRINKAKRLYRRVLETDPAHPEALHLLGTIAFHEGEDSRALELIRKAIDVDGGVTAFHLTLGNVLRHAGRLEEARNSIRDALALKPDSADAHCLWGDVAAEQGQREEAVEAYHRALALTGRDSELSAYIRNKLSQAHSYALTPVERRHVHWLSFVSAKLADCPPIALLDIGSDVLWLTGIAAKFERLVSVDIRSHPCRHVLPFEHVRGDILDLPFDGASFDVITMPQVLHWAGSGCYGQAFAEDVAARALAEVARVLRPEGRVIGATFVKPGRTRGAEGMQKTFGAAELLGMFDAAGFAISEARYFLHETMESVSLADIESDSARDLYPYPRLVSPYYVLFELTRGV